MSLKLGLSFLRIEADYEELPDLPTIFKKMQETAENRMKVAKTDYQNCLKEEIENMILEEEKLTRDDIDKETIWRCFFPECDKKFKTCEFLAKHIGLKHPELRGKV